MRTGQDGTSSAPRALIVGASFAGLTSAFWMEKLGYRVTVVELGPELKKGGTPVDIRDETVVIVERMGILDAIRDKSLPPRVVEFVNIDGGIDARLEPEPVGADNTVDGYEIPRDDLLGILFASIEDSVEIRFGQSVSALTDVPDGIRASFQDGSEGEFAVVLGCDGNHSAVRSLRFGPEAEFSHFLHNYFSVAIVDETLIAPNTSHVLSTPGRTLLVNAYENKTDISFLFHADDELSYDRHDPRQQKNLVRAKFADAGAAFSEFLRKAESADNFYFDKLSQTKMPHWTSGRVALVGDSGYCASPAAGMGGSLAIIGATALYDAFETAGPDIDAAFEEYERTLSPIVEKIQAMAVDFGLASFFPATDEEIQMRNARFAGN